MIWLGIIAAFVIARLKRSLEILQRINRDICPQKTCLSLPTEKIAVVLLANILESVGILLDRSETYSHRVCNSCGRKIRNLGSLYALTDKETRKPEENPSREDEKVPAKSKDAGKRLFCERTPDQNNRSPSLKSQRVKSAGKSISSRQSLRFGKDAVS